MPSRSSHKQLMDAGGVFAASRRLRNCASPNIAPAHRGFAGKSVARPNQQHKIRFTLAVRRVERDRMGGFNECGGRLAQLAIRPCGIAALPCRLSELSRANRLSNTGAQSADCFQQQADALEYTFLPVDLRPAGYCRAAGFADQVHYESRIKMGVLLPPFAIPSAATCLLNRHGAAPTVFPCVITWRSSSSTSASIAAYRFSSSHLMKTSLPLMMVASAFASVFQRKE
jgi:hypothetical protein